MAELPWYLVLDDIGRRSEALKRKKTRADRIRSMSDEELANKMSGLESFALTCGGGWSSDEWLKWLQEVE